MDYTITDQRGVYIHEGHALWEIEVDHSLRTLAVIASNGATDRKWTDDHGWPYVKAPGIRIRDTYCGEHVMAERAAVTLTAAEARRLACALLAAAEEYEVYLSSLSVTA